MQRTQCPHCFRTVYVHEDRKCPACWGNVNERSKEHDGLTLVEFVDGEELPPVCIVCGRPSQYRLEVGEKNPKEKLDWNGGFAQFLGALAGLIAIRLKPPLPVKEYKISVRLPVCADHREAKTLEPLHVDYRRYRMTFPACPAFIDRWKKKVP